jgi:CRP/FNR family transcriptional regulator, anaerobic regulatory protein
MQLASVAATNSSPMHGTKPARPLLRDVGRQSTSCLGCNLRSTCMPVAVQDPEAKELFAKLVTARVRLRKGEILFRAGDRFTAVYAIRIGSCKLVMPADQGNEQVSGYHLPGEIIGIEAMGNEAHTCHAIALEDTEVCALPFDRLENLAHEDIAFQRHLYRLLTAAIVSARGNALMLGTMRAEQRLASFLLDLSQRYHELGYSSTEYVLRMTREEIGSLLGLKLETVSRLFSRFAEERLIQVQGRVVRLLDRIGLQHLLAAN